MTSSSFLFGLQSVGESGSICFAYDAHDVETSNPSCVLGGFLLLLIEVGRDSQDHVFDVSLELLILVVLLPVLVNLYEMLICRLLHSLDKY